MKTVIVIYYPYGIKKTIDIDTLKMNMPDYNFLLIEDPTINNIKVEVFFI